MNKYKPARRNRKVLNIDRDTGQNTPAKVPKVRMDEEFRRRSWFPCWDSGFDIQSYDGGYVLLYSRLALLSDRCSLQTHCDLKIGVLSEYTILWSSLKLSESSSPEEAQPENSVGLVLLLSAISFEKIDEEPI